MSLSEAGWKGWIRGGIEPSVERIEKFKPGHIHGVGGIKIALGVGLFLKLLDGDAFAQELAHAIQAYQLLQRVCTMLCG